MATADPSLENGLAQVDAALEANNPEAAQKALLPLERTHARDARVLTARARMLAQQGDLPGARRILEDVVQANPMVAQPSAYLGQVLAGLQQWALARPRLEKALQLGLDKPSVRHALGVVLARMERPADAVTHLRKAADQDPQNLDILIQLASALDDAGKATDAEEVVRRFQQVAPGEPQAWVLLANFQKDHARPDAALQTLDEAAKKFPKEATALARARAAILSSQGKHAEVAQVVRAIADADRNAEDWAFLSTILMQEKKPADALKAARKAVELDGSWWRGHHALGLALEETQPANGDAVVAAYRKAVELGDPDGLAGTRLGLLLLTVPGDANTEAAIEVLEATRERAGNPPATLWNLALAYARARNTDKVKTICQALVRADIDPDLKQLAQDLLAELPRIKR